MALARLELGVIQRSRGRSATAAAAYRAGARIADRRTGEVHDYRRRTGVVATALFGPTGALDGGGREAAWNAAEAAERRRDAVVGRELTVALPAELSADERAALARDFATQLAREEGVLVDLAIHAPARRGDERNHHGHLLFSTRVVAVDGDGRVVFGDKTRVWDHKVTGGSRLTAWRTRFEAVTNVHLARAGSAARIDMRSLAAQGATRAPGRHDGPTRTRAKRDLAVVRTRMATVRARLDGLALAHRLGVDTGFLGAVADSMRAAAVALRLRDTSEPEIAVATRSHIPPTPDR